MDPENKIPSKYNAVKHGILQQLVSEYERDFYDPIIAELDAAYEPEGAVERMLVDRIGVCILRLHRSVKAENEYMRSVLDPRKVVVKETWVMTTREEIVEHEGYTPVVGEAAITKLADTYLRYETSIENRLYKALHELWRIQSIRRGEKVVPPLSLDVGMREE